MCFQNKHAYVVYIGVTDLPRSNTKTFLWVEDSITEAANW